MPSKEHEALVEKVARKIAVGVDEDTSSKVIAVGVVSIILDELLEQFDNVNDDPFIPQGAKNYIHRFLAASALGEQSE